MDLTKLMGILVYSSHSSYFIEFDVYQQIAKIEECPLAKTNLSDVEQLKSTLNDVPEQIYPIPISTVAVQEKIVHEVIPYPTTRIILPPPSPLASSPQILIPIYGRPLGTLHHNPKSPIDLRR
jgi:hypothetical protein